MNARSGYENLHRWIGSINDITIWFRLRFQILLV